MIARREHLVGPRSDQLVVDDWGSEDAFPVIVASGSPGSRRLFRVFAEHVVPDHGVRLLSFDRPGYGNRPPAPGRLVVDSADDVAAIAASLGIDRLAVWGYSGGGPHALAAAARLPSLVAGAVIMASFGPRHEMGSHFEDELAPAFQEAMREFDTDRARARATWAADADAIKDELCTSDGWMARWGASPGRDASHGKDLAEHLAALNRDAFHQGDQGWWDDWEALLKPWGFSTDEVRVPVSLWYGTSDQAIPASHGSWLLQRLERAQLHRVEADHTDIEQQAECRAIRWLTAGADF